jgi:hypothetical protein
VFWCSSPHISSNWLSIFCESYGLTGGESVACIRLTFFRIRHSGESVPRVARLPAPAIRVDPGFRLPRITDRHPLSTVAVCLCL